MRFQRFTLRHKCSLINIFLEHHFLKHLWRAASAELNLLVWACSNNYVTQNLYINIHFPLIHTHTLRKKYLVTFTKDRKILKFQNYVLVPILYKVCWWEYFFLSNYRYLMTINIVTRNGKISGNMGRLNRSLYVMLKFTEQPKTPGITSKKT